jgi:hypothetical protein
LLQAIPQLLHPLSLSLSFSPPLISMFFFPILISPGSHEAP